MAWNHAAPPTVGVTVDGSIAHQQVRMSVDEAIAHYLTCICDGPTAVESLGRLGFEVWCCAFTDEHQRDEDDGLAGPWDSRLNTAAEMRAIYDGIRLHASRTVMA